MDSDNQKVYPTLNGHQQQQHVHPSQQQQQYGFSMPPPSYDGGQQNAMSQPGQNPGQQPYVITQQPTTVIVQTARLGPDPQQMTCPSCRATIQTSVKYEPATKTHLFAGLICLLGCWCGCCMIPYCVDSCQNATHTCPNCGNYLGSHE